MLHLYNQLYIPEFTGHLLIRNFYCVNDDLNWPDIPKRDSKLNVFESGNRFLIGGGETGCIYVLSYQVRWQVHI